MNQIYVVEGTNDIIRLKQVFPNINVVSVNGSAINEDIVKLLKARASDYEIVLCMDPDYAGKRIRNYLAREIGEVTHIFIERADAHNKNHTKIGFEHATDEVLKEIFKKHIKQNNSVTSNIDISFLYSYKLIGSVDSKSRRAKLAKKLNLGHVNGKLLLNRLNTFNISKKEVIEAINSQKR